MFSWASYRFVRLSLAFILGIFIAYRWPGLRHLVFDFFLYACLVLGLLYFFLKPKRMRRFRPLIGMLCLLIFFLAGYTRYSQSVRKHDPLHLYHVTETPTFYRSIIIEPEREKPNKNQVLAKIQAIKVAGQWKVAKGKVLFTYKREELKFSYGDQLIIKGGPRFIPSPSNPHAFNYQQFMSFQQVWHQHFLTSDKVLVLGNFPPSRFMNYIYRLRSSVIGVFREHIKGEEAFQVVKAMVIGVREGLSIELKDSYSISGTMHILAVSGLHVGILYSIIYAIFGGITRRSRGRGLFYILAIFLLWIYAILTGLSPSVFRATVMLTLVIIGQARQQGGSFFNSLAMAALLLLLYNPSSLFQVGFQFSFLAVSGIVFFQPKIFPLLKFEGVLLNWAWKLMTVSFSAQLMILPLSIYYFHFLPVYFLFANLIAIPAAIGILWLGLILLSCSFLYSLAGFLGVLLEGIVLFLNTSMRWIRALPASHVDELYLDEWQVLVIYTLGLTLILCFIFRNLTFLKLAFLISLFFSGYTFNQKKKQNQQQKLVFYDTNESILLDLIEGRRSLLVTDTSSESLNLFYDVFPNWVASGVKSEILPMGQEGKVDRLIGALDLVVWKNKRIIFFSRPSKKDMTLTKPVAVDYVVIRNNSLTHLEPVIKNFEFDLLIIDSTNKKYIGKKLEMEAEKFNLPFYSTKSSGALIVDL
ncbi:ComEC/Rec2 family competence protein [Xanthovirga aplysinae]|uniref:ComEC/Rec2 family competence protein n=1 Tax=Xanthovirga aplysinae TaxID=2529853 RepID=UPI0012BC0A03|nr:ComEC/Rec2 family competence protein [Xanthovirga aplysinae]MTI33565.1 ComEC family competence protein [Xanthovirga aplysinae]